MSWTRAELKSRAKAAFYRNYWKCVLAALILSFISGSGGSSGSSAGSSYTPSNYEQDYEYDDYDFEYDYDDDFQYNFSDAGAELIQSGDVAAIVNPATLSMTSGETALIGGIAIFIIFIIIIVLIVGILINIFVFMPIQVGGCHFFLENAVVNTAGVGLLFKTFKTNYKKAVLTMFLRNLYTALWTLLFIVPGIIKGYEYYMVPYILADHPEMDHKEVFALSKKMMDGEKWNTFVLELSFIGWNLLSIFTLGLLSIFYVNPYMHATDAELYLTLKRNKCTQPVYDPYNTYNSYNAYTDNNNPYQSY